MTTLATNIPELVKVITPETVRVTVGRAVRQMEQAGVVDRVDAHNVLVRSVSSALARGVITADVLETMLSCLRSCEEVTGDKFLHDLVWNLCGGDAGYKWASETQAALSQIPTSEEGFAQAMRSEAFSPLQTLVKRRQRALRRKQLGIKKGSGYAIRGGQRVRLSPEQQMRLKRQGREMARKTTHQLMMQRGGKRAAAIFGRARKQKKLSSHKEDLYKKGHTFSEAYVCRAIDVAAEGRLDDALRLLLRDADQAESPIWKVADEVFESFRQFSAGSHEQSVGSGSTDISELFFDVEVVNDQFIMAFSDPLLGPGKVTEHLSQFGEAALLVKAGEPISDSETSLYHIFSMIPSEQSLKRHNEAVTTGNVSGYTDSPLQKPKIVSPDDLSTTEFPDDKAMYRKKGKKSQHPRGSQTVSPPPENRNR